MQLKDAEFEFDRETVWQRYAGKQAMKSFLQDGNVLVRGVLNWIIKDEDIMAMVDVEFEMYEYHLRKQNGKSNLG